MWYHHLQVGEYVDSIENKPWWWNADDHGLATEIFELLTELRQDPLSDSHFSTTYAEARRRFRAAATAAGATITSHVIDAECEDELAIDVAAVGAENAPGIVISSGVHGVEGFFGSAIQHAVLKRIGQESSPPSIRYILIHAVNPFGLSRLRRCNEGNVDLNRNFLTSAGD